MNIGEYKVTTERSENSLYRWVEAVNTQKEKTVIIQILQPGISPEITANLISYFDTLQAIRRKNLWMPEQVFSNADYPLVLIYPYLSTTPLTEVLQQSTQEEAIEWWHQASETLHTLHNKNIVHGCIALDSFVVVERSVCLTGFGYAPFLQMGEPKAIQECREVVAPEVLADHYLTSAADIYGFAKTVANWQPQLLTTSWYSQAANPNPEFRYPRIRDCFQYLQETLLRCVPEEYNEAQRTKTSEDAVETESNHQHQDIIPKYILEAKVEPSEAGEVCGGGSYPSYPEPKSVLVKAQPLAGWHFDHWSGDIEGEESSVTLTMDHDKLILAYFVPDSLPETLFDDSSTKKHLEQENLESEKKVRLEAERKLKVKEEQERQRVERERIEKEKLEAKTRSKNGIIGLLVGLCLAGGTVIFSLVQQQLQQQQNFRRESTIVHPSPVLVPPTNGNSSFGTTAITSQEALDLIDDYLQAQVVMYASPYNRQIAAELTAGEKYKEIMRNIDQLQLEGISIRYSNQQIQSINVIATYANLAATVRATLLSEWKGYDKNNTVMRMSAEGTVDVTYSLQFIDGRWKIINSFVNK